MYGSPLEHDQKRGFLMRFDDARTFPPAPFRLNHPAPAAWEKKGGWGEGEGIVEPHQKPTFLIML